MGKTVTMEKVGTGGEDRESSRPVGGSHRSSRVKKHSKRRHSTARRRRQSSRSPPPGGGGGRCRSTSRSGRSSRRRSYSSSSSSSGSGRLSSSSFGRSRSRSSSSRSSFSNTRSRSPPPDRNRKAISNIIRQSKRARGVIVPAHQQQQEGETNENDIQSSPGGDRSKKEPEGSRRRTTRSPSPMTPLRQGVGDGGGCLVEGADRRRDPSLPPPGYYARSLSPPPPPPPSTSNRPSSSSNHHHRRERSSHKKRRVRRSRTRSRSRSRSRQPPPPSPLPRSSQAALQSSSLTPPPSQAYQAHPEQYESHPHHPKHPNQPEFVPHDVQLANGEFWGYNEYGDMWCGYSMQTEGGQPQFRRDDRDAAKVCGEHYYASSAFIYDPLKHQNPPRRRRSDDENQIPSYFVKPAMQCFHWDNPTHLSQSVRECKFWHPRERCRFYPHCSLESDACGYAHPFCGVYCACNGKHRDPQKNHRFIGKTTIPTGDREYRR